MQVLIIDLKSDITRCISFGNIKSVYKISFSPSHLRLNTLKILPFAMMRSNQVLREIKGRVYEGELKDKNIWICSKNFIDVSFIYNLYGYENIYMKEHGYIMSGYNKQKCILLYNMNKKYARRYKHLICKMGDRYPYRGDTKGSWLWVYPVDYDLVITSSYSPDEIYSGYDLDMIKRRFCVISLPYTKTTDGN